MHITKAHFTNYRCFEDYEIEFASHVNILIGVNGSGKSNVLSALRKSLSRLLAENQLNNGPYGFNLYDSFFDGRERKFKSPLIIETWAIFQDKTLHWESAKISENNSDILKSDFPKFIKQHYEQTGFPFMPMFAYYSDAYPNVTSDKWQKARVIEHLRFLPVLPRNFAYSDWASQFNYIPFWIKRYEQLKMSILPWKEHLQHSDALAKDPTMLAFEEELNFIEKKIKDFTAPLVDYPTNGIAQRFQIAFLRFFKGIEFVFQDGRSMPFEMLPQGYKRLFSIVLDLAFRACTLNGAKRESGGIVFIDEVDLHLHPSLQQEVVQRFSRTFPEMQFILTTHSPLVLTNLKTSGEYADKQRIIQLSTNENNHYSNEIVEGIYGIDYSTAVSEIMHTPARNSTVESFIQSYHVLKAQGYDEAAQRTEQQLAEYLGLTDLPQSIKDELYMYDND